MKTYVITAELIPEDVGGFTVYCPELDIYTQGETEEECLANLQEAAELHVETVGEDAGRSSPRTFPCSRRVSPPSRSERP